MQGDVLERQVSWWRSKLQGATDTLNLPTDHPRPPKLTGQGATERLHLPPELAAVMSATFELSCSALIVVGLATRLATLPLLGMTFVIEVFVYPEYWSMHLMWATVLLFMLTKGPGAFSLDHYAGRILRAKGILA